MDPSYHRRSENEYEFINFVLPTLEGGNSAGPSSSRRAMHNSMMTGAHRVNEILTGHEERCKKNFRMEVSVFQDLVHLLREKKLLSDGYAVSVEEQVAIFLYGLTKNATTDTLADYFNHSLQTINYYFKEVLNAITQLTSVYIRPPSLHPHPTLSKPQFYPFLRYVQSRHFTFSKFIQYSLSMLNTRLYSVCILCFVGLHRFYRWYTHSTKTSTTSARTIS